MIHTPIFFWLSIAAVVVASFFHVKSCQQFFSYGLYERNPLWKDKYGFFATTKYVISLAIFCAVMAVLHYLWMGYQTGIMFYVMTGFFVVNTLINNSGAKRNRAIQTQILTQLQAQARAGNVDPTDSTIDKIINVSVNGKHVNPTVARNGRVWYRLFPWLFIEGAGGFEGQTEAIIPLRNKLITWSQQSEANWFPKS